MAARDDRSQTISELRAVHTPQAVSRRLAAARQDSNLGDFVLGAVDGAITTFAVAAGAVGAELSTSIVVVLGVANLLADGFSMGISVFLGSRAETQRVERTRRMEEMQIDLVPEGEMEEIRQIYAAKGFEGAELERVVEVITSDRDRWVETMIREEHGLLPEGRDSRRAGGVTFLAFLVVGLIPLLPFIVDIAISGGVSSPFIWSIALTGVAFFGVGAVKSRFVDGSWWYEGLETMAVGAVAAGLAYAVGVLLRGLVDSI